VALEEDEDEDSETWTPETTTSGPSLSLDDREIATLCCDLLFFEEEFSDVSSSAPPLDFDRGWIAFFDDFGDFAGSTLCETLFLGAPPVDVGTERSKELFVGEGGDSTGKATGRDGFCEKVMCCP